MKKFLLVLLESFIDSVKILPILLVVYFLIEFFEYKQASKFERMKFMNKKNSPIIGSLFGTIPQCGFSVVATDLYTKRKVTVGALIAVYIATSDEALPILIAQPSAYKSILPLLLVKIIVAIVIGYASQFLFDIIFNRKKEVVVEQSHQENEHSHEEHDHKGHNHDTHEHESHEHEESVVGCCKHDIEHSKFSWKHPLLHCVKIIISIFIINIILGCVIEFGFKGEENLANFLTKNSIYALQPLLAMLIGFIPNCASSVVLTELFLIEGLSFGSLCAGLIANAGLGLVLLFRHNKRPKENLFIIACLIFASLATGYLLHYLVP